MSNNVANLISQSMFMEISRNQKVFIAHMVLSS